MTVSPRIPKLRTGQAYLGIATAAAMSLAAFALCVTANRLLGWAVWWMTAIVVGTQGVPDS